MDIGGEQIVLGRKDSAGARVGFESTMQDDNDQIVFYICIKMSKANTNEPIKKLKTASNIS